MLALGGTPDDLGIGRRDVAQGAGAEDPAVVLARDGEVLELGPERAGLVAERGDGAVRVPRRRRRPRLGRALLPAGGRRGDDDRQFRAIVVVPEFPRTFADTRTLHPFTNLIKSLPITLL